MAYDKVSRCLDVVLVEVSICHIQLVSHNDGVADLVELRIESVGRGLPVEQAIAGHRAINQLLVIKQEVHSSARRRKVAVKREASPSFMEVARKNCVGRAEEGSVGTSRRDSLSPGGGEACYYGTGEGFILGCLHHVSAQVVFAHKLVPLFARCALKIGWRGVQAVIVSVPPGLVALLELAKLGRERRFCCTYGSRLACTEAQCQLEHAAPGDICLGRLYQVAIVSLCIKSRELVRGVELYQSVAWLAGETVAHISKGIRGVECTIDGFGIVSIGSVAFRDSIEGYRHVVTGRGVDRAGVATPVPTAATTIAVDTGIVAHIKLIGGQIAYERYEVDIHDHRFPIRIGQVVSYDAILSAFGGCRYLAVKGVRILAERLHGIGSIARLQIGEGTAICDDILESLDVSIVNSGALDIAENPICNGEPDFGGRIASGAKTILACEVEVGERSRAIRSGGRRSRRCTKV